MGWENPRLVAIYARYLDSTLVVFWGVYLWEFMITWNFEWKLITGQIAFKWPFIPYLVGRYCMLSTLSSLIAINQLTRYIDCGAVYKALSLLGNIAIGCATTNLMIRTFIIWRKRRYVAIPLVMVSMSHWGYLAYIGITNIEGYWSSKLLCVVNYTSHTKLVGLYLFTMSYDFLVLFFTVLGLAVERSSSRLWINLQRQGILYFVITSLANIAPCALSWLNLNPVLNILTSAPAACISIIASSRAVIFLMEHPELRYDCPSSYGTHELEEEEGVFCFPPWLKRRPLEDPPQLTSHISLHSSMADE